MLNALWCLVCSKHSNMILDIIDSSEGERFQSLNKRLGESPEVLCFMGEGAHPKGLMDDITWQLWGGTTISTFLSSRLCCLHVSWHLLPAYLWPPSTLGAPYMPMVFSKFGNILAIPQRIFVCLPVLPFLSRTPIIHLLVVPHFTDALPVLKTIFLLVFLSF